MSSAAVSPLEQLEQQSAQAQPPQQAAPASNLSPLEQLEKQQPATQQTTQPSQPLSKQIMGQPFIDEVRSTFSRENEGKSLNLGAGAVGGTGVAGAAVGAGEKLLNLTESQLGKFAEAYPHIVKLTSALGGPAMTIGGMYELFKHLSKGK